MGNEIQLSENSKAAIVAAADYRNMLVSFTKDVLKENVDFGIIPGVTKPSLLKPGSEKLINLFGLSCEMDRIDKEFDLQNKFIAYTYKATIKNKEGRILSQCEGSVNSYETKYRYSWINTDKKPSKEEAASLKAQGAGKWGKIGNDWVWKERQENPDVIGLQNTIQKMAQKRAMVGAVLIATGASEFFTQDVEDMGFIDVDHKEVEPEKPSAPAASNVPEPSTDEKVNSMLKKEINNVAADAPMNTMIKAMIDNSFDQKSLVEVWNNNPSWHSNKAFCDHMTAKKKELARPQTKTKKEVVA